MRSKEITLVVTSNVRIEFQLKTSHTVHCGGNILRGTVIWATVKTTERQNTEC
jgi:hypothetical protein